MAFMWIGAGHHREGRRRYGEDLQSGAVLLLFIDVAQYRRRGEEVSIGGATEWRRVRMAKGGADIDVGTRGDVFLERKRNQFISLIGCELARVTRTVATICARHGICPRQLDQPIL